jgi:hypothetical protein
MASRVAALLCFANGAVNSLRNGAVRLRSSPPSICERTFRSPQMQGAPDKQTHNALALM